MHRSLLLISLLACSLLMQAQALKVSSDSISRYSIEISFREAVVTGVCLLRDNGCEIVGIAINEFGIKAVEFIFDKQKGKVKLLNTIKYLDRWYIKRVLRYDLAFLLRPISTKRQQRKRIVYTEDGSIVLADTRYKITYKFKPLHETER